MASQHPRGGWQDERDAERERHDRRGFGRSREPYLGYDPSEFGEYARPDEDERSRDERERRGSRRGRQDDVRDERAFADFEDWQQPRRVAAGGVYGGTPSEHHGGRFFQRGYERDRLFGRIGDEGRARERFGRGDFGSFGAEGYRERDASRRGSFAGRGPKNYTRADERIREDACEQLTADPDVDAVDITVTVAGGEVTLDGTVPERGMKRAAEDCVESIPGVREVHNRLRFAPDASNGERMIGLREERPGQAGPNPNRSGENS
jgi:hypothetical protein